MLKWSLDLMELPLKFAWSISRGTSLIKRNFLINIEGNGVSAQGEVAFNSRYGESEELIRKSFESFINLGPQKLSNLEEFTSLISDIDIPKSLRFGLESAFVHYLSKLKNVSPAQVLGSKQADKVSTSFSLPIMPIGEIKDFIKDHQLERFSHLKVKVEKESALEAFKEVLKVYNGHLRIDANESWKDPSEIISFVSQIGKERIEFLEQPMPASLVEESIELKRACDCVIIADESITDGKINHDLLKGFDGVNIKLMKTGGYIKAIEQINEAKKLGLKTMIGCMIESSLGIWSAMQIAGELDYYDLDGFLLIKNDPQKRVNEESGTLNFSD